MAIPHPALGDIIVGAAAIQSRVTELADEIDVHYAGAASPVLLLCVLKGALIFTADLVRRLSVPCEIDFIAVSSYEDRISSSGTPRIVGAWAANVAGRDVLIVEDIVDSGHTAAFLLAHLNGLGARSVRLVTLLDKASRRTQPVRIDWKGFDIPDRFVVGYGLDHGERFRNLAEVRALDVK